MRRWPLAVVVSLVLVGQALGPALGPAQGDPAQADPGATSTPTGSDPTGSDLTNSELAEKLSTESLQTEAQPLQPVTAAPRRAARESARTAGTTGAPHEVQLTHNGAWSWPTDPRVLETPRSTYFGYVARSGSVVLSSVRHSDARMETTTLRRRQLRDDHIAPALLRMTSGKIVAFWSGHADEPVRYRVSQRPEDISAMGRTHVLKGSGLEDEPSTYAQIFHLRGSSRPYHLLTRRDSDRMWMLTTSRDLRTWSPAVEVIKPSRWDVETWPYVEATSDGWKTIHLTMTDGHPDDQIDTSLFHMYYRTDDRALRRSSGALITRLSATRQRPADSRRGTTIYNGRSVDGRVRVYDVALAGGQPAVAFTTLDRGVQGATYTHKWSRRTASGTWETWTVARRRGRPRGIAVDSGDGYKLHLVNGVGGDDRVRELVTGDGGRTWQATPLSAVGNDLRTPTSPFGDAQRFSVLWMKGGYPNFRDFRTGIRGSTTGPTPITLAMSAPDDWRTGGSITGLVRQGIGGPGEAGVRVVLLVIEPGKRQRWVRSGTTSSTGRVTIPVNRFYPRGTSVRLYAPAADGRGAAYGPSHMIR